MRPQQQQILRLFRLAQHLNHHPSTSTPHLLLAATTSNTSSRAVTTAPAFTTTTALRRFTTTMGDEVAAARMAAAKKMEEEADAGGVTIFDKIARKEIPCNFIHEDDQCVAFHDMSPQGPVHFLVIPKDRQGLSRLSKATEEHKALLGHLLFVAQKVAKEQGLTPDGFRVVINDGPNGSQSVYHLHLHVIGGRSMGWPPG